MPLYNNDTLGKLLKKSNFSIVTRLYIHYKLAIIILNAYMYTYNNGESIVAKEIPTPNFDTM